MGISLLTVLAIRNHRSKAYVEGPNKKGLWAGFISHEENNGNYRIDISTDFCFKNKTQALKETRKFVKEIKGFGLHKSKRKP